MKDGSDNKSWFDFTNFEDKVRVLNDLNRNIQVLSDIRLKTKAQDDISRWKQAVDKWKHYSGCGWQEDLAEVDVKFYIFENVRFLAALTCGENNAVECAITFLEHDPYYFRSGYMKGKLLVRLKHISLSKKQIQRLQRVVVNAIYMAKPKSEFCYYARLIKNIGTPEFRETLKTLPVPSEPYLKVRLERCLEDVYWVR